MLPEVHAQVEDRGGKKTVGSTAPADSVWTSDHLLAAERTGHRLKFVFFWGHTPPPSGQIGGHVLSQWYPSEFVVDGVTYPTAEHFMMAEKARLFADSQARQAIRSAGTPEEAKSLGRSVRGFDSAIWSAQRSEVVTRGSVAKFSANASLRSYLVGTGDQVLVEASPVDPIWGIGLAADHPDATKPSAWRGQNLLGIALMQARAQLAIER